MDKKLMDILCCPVCKAELELKITKELANDIIEGTLICRTCHFPYPIEEGIPNLLPPEYHKED